MKHWPLILVLALVTGCTGSNGDRPDLVDAGGLQCGAHTVVRGGCASRCPAPCVCVTFFTDHLDPSFVPFELCATPCSVPGSCPGTERCGVITYSFNQNQQPVCLPNTLQTPAFPSGTAYVDCFLTSATPSLPQCFGDGYLAQNQPFFTSGGVSGSYCADVMLETCPGGCVWSGDAGPLCKGAPDAGVPATDAGITCCPSNMYGACRFLGGAKIPPHGCRMSCCMACQWTAGMDVYGCEMWEVTALDAGIDS